MSGNVYIVALRTAAHGFERPRAASTRCGSLERRLQNDRLRSRHVAAWLRGDDDTTSAWREKRVRGVPRRSNVEWRDEEMACYGTTVSA